MPVARSARVLGFALLLAVAAAPAGAAERRAIVTEGTDYFGRDYQTLKDVDLSDCEAACVADRQCQAFTYNVKARWCFMKAEFGDLRAFAGATSGRIVEGEIAGPEVEAERLAELGFLAQDVIDTARRLAGDIGQLAVAGTLDEVVGAAGTAATAGDFLKSADQFRLALRMAPERIDLWDAFVNANLSVRSDDWSVRQRVQDDAVAGAINGYIRSVDAGDRAIFLDQLSQALALKEAWRPAIKAARASLAAADNPAVATRLDTLVAEHGFRIVENTVDTQSAEPRVCVTFSDPIAKDDPNITDFVSVAGGETLAIEADDSQICISGVDYGGRYKVTVRQGLPSRDGEETLQKTVELESFIRDRDAQVRFVGKAYVLPKGGDATIPVVTVNVESLKTEVFRIGDRNLVQAVGEGTFLRQLGSWETGDISSRRGESVWSGTVAVDRTLNKDVTTAIPVGEMIKDLKPGVYAMTAVASTNENSWGELATQWFVVTDLGLSSLSGNDGLHMVVRSLSTAGAVDGATLQLIAQNNEVLGTATTDAEGYARFDPGLIRGEGGNAPALVTAAAGEGDFAFLDLTKAAFDLTDRGVEGRPSPEPVDVFMTTERGVYRPGETVYVTTLARDPAAKAVSGVPLTLVVSRPDGVEYSRTQVEDEGAGGRDNVFPLTDGAMRGSWRIAAFTDPEGASIAETTFLVEDFLPERIDFDLKTEAAVLEPGTTATASLEARWLYGAPAANLAIEGEVYVTRADGVPAAPGFSFGLVEDTFEPVAESISGGPTGEDGAASVDLVTPELADTTLPLKAAVHVRVLDSNGRPVERKLSLPVDDGSVRLGIDPLFEESVEEGGNASFDVVALSGGGERVDAKGVTWTLYKVNTDYQWYNLDGSWNYEAVKSKTRVANGTLDIAAGGSARVEGRVEWGEYELALEDPEGALVPASLRFEAGWYVPPSAEETPDLLKVSLDKPRYAVGETLTARLEARYPGVALVRVVDDRLIAMKTVEVPEGGATVELPVTESWGPGAYVTATLLRPMDIEAKRMPARALGLQWATVEPGDRLLDVQLAVPAEQRPRQDLVVEAAIANAAAGEEAFVTLAAVDVGILNLTHFQPPAPETWYFGQRALGMEMRDVYGQLIDRMLGTRGQVRSGGDGSGLSRLEGTPPTERLVAFFQGVTRVDADGKVRASFPIPDFNGTVRVMAIAWSPSGVGHASADVLVRDPVVVAAALPNFLAPGDRSRLRLDLTHVEGPAGPMTLDVQSAGGLVDVEEGTERTVDLAEKGTATVLLPLVAKAVGDETLTVTLRTSAGDRLTKTLTVPVRANEPPNFRETEMSLRGGDGRLDIAPDLFADFVPGTARATLTVGGVAGLDLPGIVSELDKYPYGCAEQITSRALPLVYLDDVVLAAGLTGEQPVRDRVQDAIARVLVNQGSNGSFGLWGPGSEDLWLDSYVTDFLTRAREKGFEVPANAYELAVTNLKNKVAYASDFSSGGEPIAYALYVLARNGKAALADLRYYAETKLDAFGTPLAKAQLGAALALYGDTEGAASVFGAATDLLARRTDTKTWRSDYGSDLRDGAAILTLASESHVGSVDFDRLTAEIRDLKRQDRWASTQEQAWMLLAANALIADGRKSEVAIGGKLEKGLVTRSFRADEIGGGLAVENRTDQPVEARLTVTGVPVTPEPAGGTGYELRRAYYDLDGNEVALNAVPLGARFVAVLTVTVTTAGGARLMVDDPLPAGLAIDNPNLVAAGDVAMLDWLQLAEKPARTEFRADRFVAAVDQYATNATEFQLAYMVRAVAPGSYAHPAATVVDMYRPAMRARTDSGRVEVVGPVR